MEERGYQWETVDDSKMPADSASPAASNGKSSQERKNASNKGDSSPNEEIVKVWSQKAAGWRFVTAKYIQDQRKRGEPSYWDERAWVPHGEFSGWFKHEEKCEVDDPEKDRTSWTWADRSSKDSSHKESSHKDDASNSSKKNKDKDKKKPKRYWYRHKDKASDDEESAWRTWDSDDSDNEDTSSVSRRLDSLNLEDDDPRDLRCLKEGDIPKWDGNTSRRDFYRAIDMWACATNLPPKYRAIRLLQNLRGNAWTKMEHVEPLALKKQNGVQIFKDLVEKAYEPIGRSSHRTKFLSFPHRDRNLE